MSGQRNGHFDFAILSTSFAMDLRLPQGQACLQVTVALLQSAMHWFG
jgi:hypothetical protein